jgi:small secreted domain DUF320
MKKVRWVSATAGAALVAAMFALPGAGVAYASDNGNTTGNGNVSILSGNTITAPISAPVNLCGISLAVAGFSNAARLHDQLHAEHPAHRPARQPPGWHHHHGDHRDGP